MSETELTRKERIAQKEREKKRWLTYYQEHKAEILERKKQQRIAKQQPIDEEKIKRYYELMEEVQQLHKEVLRKNKMEKNKKNE